MVILGPGVANWHVVQEVASWHSVLNAYVWGVASEPLNNVNYKSITMATFLISFIIIIVI